MPGFNEPVRVAASEHILAADEVVEVEEAIAVRDWNLVAEGMHQVAGPVQLAGLVVGLRCNDAPRIFVHVEAALAVDVPLAGLQRGLEHPDAMPFPAHAVRIQKLRTG